MRQKLAGYVVVAVLVIPLVVTACGSGTTLEPTATPAPAVTPVPTATPVMYKLAPNTYAPEGVWESIDRTHPQIYMMVAAKVQTPNDEADVHAVLSLVVSCDAMTYRLGVAPSIPLNVGVHSEASMRLASEKEYRTTWWNLSIGIEEPANLWRLYGTAQSAQWPDGFPSPHVERPFWGSLIPGLYAGKDLHFSIDDQLTATFDAEGFQGEWDSLTPSCSFDLSSPVSEAEVQVTQEEYRAWVIDLTNRTLKLDGILLTCGLTAEEDEAVMDSEAVKAAFRRADKAEAATSPVAKRALPDGYDARYDMVSDEAWAEMAPYAPEFMAAFTGYVEALETAYRDAGCDL